MKRIAILILLIALAGSAKFGYEYFYSDLSSSAAPLPSTKPSPTVSVADKTLNLSAEELVPTDENIQQALTDLGIPAGKVDGKWGERTKQAFCIWRELTGRVADRSIPIELELREILLRAKLKQPFKLSEDYVRGLNISKTCQSVVWVKDDQRKNFVISIVSTGAPGMETDTGTFKVTWKVNRWYESISIPDGWMYRPMFFNRGQAVHGSEYDSYVWWYPASHGCVRMLGAFVDELWASGFGVGDTVRVYGLFSQVSENSKI